MTRLPPRSAGRRESSAARRRDRLSTARPAILSLAHLLLLTCFAPGRPPLAAQEGELRIGLIPEMNIFRQVERFEPLAAHIGAKLGKPVRLTMLSRYGNIVDRILNHEVDAAFLGSFTGALAIAQLEMTPIAKPVNLDGTSTYYGHIFVRRDSGIEGLEQMRGKRLALVERATTAGYIFPLAHFRAQGISALESIFAQIDFWGSHDAAIFAVLEGRADVGAAKNTIYERMARLDSRIDRDLKILISSPRVPSNGLMVASSVSPEVRKRLAGILLGLEESEQGRRVLTALGAQRFVPLSPEDYGVVFDLAQAAGIDIGSYRYTNQ